MPGVLTPEFGIQDVNWSNPINHEHPLACGLVSLWIPGVPGIRSTSLRDIGRAGNDASFGTGATWRGTSICSLAELGFDGSSNFATLSATLLPNGTSARSIFCLLKSGSSNEEVFLHYGASVGTPAGSRWTMALDSGAISLRVNSGRITLGSGLSDGNPHFVGCTIGESETLGDVEFYADGMSLGTGSSSTAINTSTTVAYLARDPVTGGVTYGDVDIQCLMAFDRQISSEQAKSLYSETLECFPELLNRNSSKRYYFAPAGGGGATNPKGVFGLALDGPFRRAVI